MEYHFGARKAITGRRAWIALTVMAALLAGAGVLYFHAPRYFELAPRQSRISGAPGERVTLLVAIEATNYVPHGIQGSYPLSGRIFEGRRRAKMVRGLERSDPLELRENVTAQRELVFRLPERGGSYTLLVDLVNEGEYWFEDVGNRPAAVRLEVR